MHSECYQVAHAPKAANRSETLRVGATVPTSAAEAAAGAAGRQAGQPGSSVGARTGVQAVPSPHQRPTVRDGHAWFCCRHRGPVTLATGPATPKHSQTDAPPLTARLSGGTAPTLAKTKLFLERSSYTNNMDGKSFKWFYYQNFKMFYFLFRNNPRTQFRLTHTSSEF